MMGLFRMAVWIAIVATVACGAAAQPVAVERGAAWLTTHQDEDGLWGARRGNALIDASVVIAALSMIPADSAIVAQARGAIEDIATSGNDCMARRILALEPAVLVGEQLGLPNELARRQNRNGGWGDGQVYGSNNLETALALQALAWSRWRRGAAFCVGYAYLQSRQNADRGWGFTRDDTSRVFYTAHALMAVEALRDSFDVSATIGSGSAWLKTRDHADGGFGTGGTSNPYETALAVLALAEADSSAPERDGAERLYFVVETKSGLFADDLRDKERAKIECGKVHFKALAVGESPAEFIQARNIDDLMAKC